MQIAMIVNCTSARQSATVTKTARIARIASRSHLSRILTGRRNRTRTVRHDRRGGERGRGRVVLSYYRVHGVALTSILIRNAIKRVIQVVIVTLPARIHFSPPGTHESPEGAEGFPGSLGCSSHADGTALVGVAGSPVGGAEEGEWRLVRGWSLKVRGTGLIAGCRRAGV